MDVGYYNRELIKSTSTKNKIFKSLFQMTNFIPSPFLVTLEKLSHMYIQNMYMTHMNGSKY